MSQTTATIQSSRIVITPTDHLVVGDRTRAWAGSPRWGNVVQVSTDAVSVQWDDGGSDELAPRTLWGKRLFSLRLKRDGEV